MPQDRKDVSPVGLVLEGRAAAKVFGDDEESDGKRREKRHAIKQHIRRKMCASLTFRISQKLFALKIVFSIVKGGDELRQQNNVIGRHVSR